MLARQLVFLDCPVQGLAHRVLGLARVAARHLVAPPRELDACDGGFTALVDHVVLLAAKRVENGHGAALVRIEKQEAVRKAGARAGGLLFAIFVRGHAQGRKLTEAHDSRLRAITSAAIATGSGSNSGGAGE